MNKAKNSIVYALATQFRLEHLYTSAQPICIFDAVVDHDVAIQFKNLSHDDGMLHYTPKPTIIISSLRPFTRQVFTCAHEMAHHIFGIKGVESTLYSATEIYEDMFAGFVLMPEAAVKYISKEMGVIINTITPREVYMIACWFGVSTNALVTQLFKAYNMITHKQYEFFKNLELRDYHDAIGVNSEGSCMIYLDRHWSERPIDLLIDDVIYAPPDASVKDKKIVATISKEEKCCIMKATRVGVTNIILGDRSIQVRVSSREYCGNYKCRYMEE